jgi:hypothetical protein
MLFAHEPGACAGHGDVAVPEATQPAASGVLRGTAPGAQLRELADPDLVASRQVHIPALFQSYLNLGAKVCGGPALDRLFKTIDFLVVLDIEALDLHSYRFFFR